MTVRDGLHGRWPDEEAELDRRIRELWGEGPENNPPEQWASMREHARLSLLYPGMFVAHRDSYEGEGKQHRLVRREVLCAAPTLEELHEHLDQVVPREEPGIQVVYIEKPDDPPWV
jgi:hypothetical protein